MLTNSAAIQSNSFHELPFQSAIALATTVPAMLKFPPTTITGASPLGPSRLHMIDVLTVSLTPRNRSPTCQPASQPSSSLTAQRNHETNTHLNLRRTSISRQPMPSIKNTENVRQWRPGMTGGVASPRRPRREKKQLPLLMHSVITS